MRIFWRRRSPRSPSIPMSGPISTIRTPASRCCKTCPLFPCCSSRPSTRSRSRFSAACSVCSVSKRQRTNPRASMYRAAYRSRSRCPLTGNAVWETFALRRSTPLRWSPGAWGKFTPSPPGRNTGTSPIFWDAPSRWTPPFSGRIRSRGWECAAR